MGGILGNPGDYGFRDGLGTKESEPYRVCTHRRDGKERGVITQFGDRREISKVSLVDQHLETYSCGPELDVDSNL